jgi:septum formation protein
MQGERRIVLASTSAYRRALLQRLGLEFEVTAPRVDEDRRPGETPAAMVERLAVAKAAEVGARFPDTLVIGSDQCAALGAEILGKPGSHERAAGQLARLSGQRVEFHTGLCLIDTANGRRWSGVVPFTVHMRDLDASEIDRYLCIERPYDCAGSFKSEALGIALFRSMDGSDPTALIGLPLIRLSDWLREAGVAVPPHHAVAPA